MLLPLTLLAVMPLQGDANPAGHRVVYQDPGHIVIQAADGTIEWELPRQGAREISELANGNLIFLEGEERVIEFKRRSSSVVWHFDGARLGEGTRIEGMQPLEHGNLLLAVASPPRLVEIDRLGNVLREIDLGQAGHEGPGLTRVLPPLISGNWLVCQGRDSSVREYEPESGAVVWGFELPGPDGAGGRRTDAFRKEDGHTLIVWGDGGSILEVDGTGELVATITGEDLGLTESLDASRIGVLADGQWVLGFGISPGTGPRLARVDPVTKAITWRDDREGPSRSDPGTQEISLLSLDAEAELRQRAREIHWRTLTLDTHKDISLTLASEELPEEPEARRDAILSQDPTIWGTNQVDFPKMRAGGLDVAFYIVYVAQGALDAAGFAEAKQVALSKFDTIERMLRRYPEHIELARTPDDVERISRSGKLVACIGIENGYAMGEDLGLIEEFHRRGARYMSITHNRHSQLGDSNTPEGEDIHGGLSDLGRRAIEEMNRLGILVDISHAGEETTMQAIAWSKAPVIASHSSVDGVFPHGRNLSDRELLALKENGGVIQIVAFATYVMGDAERDAFSQEARAELGLDRGDVTNAREKRAELRRRVREFEAGREIASVTHMIDHLDYAVDLIGIDHVAISSDFDGGGGVLGWMDASQTFNVTLELVRRGYGEEEITKLWSGNTLRIWREVEQYAAEAGE